MWGSDGRIEPIYFDYKFSELTFFLIDFLGSPGSVWLLRAAKDRFYDKKLIFTSKNLEYGNLEWDDDDSRNLEWDGGALLPRGNEFSVLRIFY